jgi:geranylgeranyl diphosphate synthase type I
MNIMDHQQESLWDLETTISHIDKKIEDLLEELVSQTPERLKPLVAQFSKFTLRPGKRIRPLLLILTYIGYSSKDRFVAEKESVFTFASILEIMHAFLLVHDDVIDESLLRRGEPTLHKVYEQFYKSEKMGKDLAIIIGDIVSFYFFGKLSDLNIDNENLKRIIKLFSDCYVKTGYGQLLDILYTGNISKDAIFENVPRQISLLKTSYYTFVYPMLFGYYLSGMRDDEEVEKLKLLGEKIGIAFQYRDDILGTFGGESKSVNDILEGKCTILIKKTYDALCESEGERFLEFLGKKDVEKVRKYILESGAFKSTTLEIANLVNESLKILKELKMSEEYKEGIEKIIVKVGVIPEIWDGGMNG